MLRLADKPGVLETVDAAEGRPVAEFDTDAPKGGQRATLQGLLTLRLADKAGVLETGCRIMEAYKQRIDLLAGQPGVLDTVDAAEGRPVAEFDTDGERTAVQKFLYPDREEMPDDFTMPIWVCLPGLHAPCWRVRLKTKCHRAEPA